LTHRSGLAKQQEAKEKPMHRTLLALLLLLGTPAMADARLDEAAFPPSQQQLERRNQAVLTYLWADVYAAAYYTAPGISPRQASRQPAGQRLELYYYRDIAREDLIKAAWTTLERQHSTAILDGLRTQIDALHSSFRDIRAGDRYALGYSPGAGLSLEINGTRVFHSDSGELARAYLGIWLAPDGLSAELREQLLAER
jgi:hypothetical protein